MLIAILSSASKRYGNDFDKIVESAPLVKTNIFLSSNFLTTTDILLRASKGRIANSS